MKIALKEADETEYWLLLCKEVSTYPIELELLNKVSGLIKILSKIVGSSKRATFSN